MATRRGFKKDMNLIYSDLLLEALDSFRASKNKDEKKISELCNKISDHHADFISRASHTDGKGNKKVVKAYYKSLWDEVLKDVMALGEEASKL
ncbi:MAG: hypothetical protein IIT93_00195 [Paludibacteraceae bacterium]|nr:hypothetical protein [Paludibacteraceae bacterium]MBQ1753166.1 hypothetical protein [Paludibacteraceae bacterium]MBQ1852055.1 hypothetical protein [Paludibacteraceae bacterium]MBQ2064625.1 hypothetical protein [Paludibacteraceae bacterium]MBQ5523922.1 hypothetical protein [Paludibacteraceae bacterium]